MKKIILIHFVIFAFTMMVKAQGCGPNCPACSGTIDGSLLAPKTLSVQGLIMPTAEEEKGILSVKYGIFNWLDAGVGYAFKAEKFIWNARLQPLKEDKAGWKPGIVLGTGSIRTGTSDQSFYLNFLKSKEFSENFAMNVSVGAASLANEIEKIYGIGNISLTFNEKYTAYVNYDGINFHEGFAWTANDWLSVGVIMIETKYPSLTVSITKGLFKKPQAEIEEL